jgi:hypothetical protein
MSAKPLRYNPDAPRTGPGVYDLNDILARCSVDDGGCWVWQSAMSTCGQKTGLVPSVGIPCGVFGRKTTHTMAASKAAWLMSGRSLRTGQILWRRVGCDAACVNPAHRTAGTRKEWGAWTRSNGSLRGDPERARSALAGQLANALAADIVHQIAALLADGKKGVEVAQQFRVSPQVVCKIRAGQHIHQRKAVRGASVFSLGNIDMRRFAA